MLKHILISIVAMSLVLSAAPVLAKSSDEHKALQEQIEELQKGQDKMMKDLEEVKKLLQQGNRPAAAPQRKTFDPVDIELGDVPFRGRRDAPVTLIEFSDYHCPFCARHAKTVMPQLIKDYVSTGKLRFVMREYPIERLHPRAVAASEAALCANDQGQYWDMHDALFEDQKTTSDEHFIQLAENMGLDVDAFTRCMEEDTFMEQIQADIAQGQELGVSGTPSFVVGLTDPENPDKVHLTDFIRGAQSAPAFTAAIDKLLKKAEGGK